MNFPETVEFSPSAWKMRRAAYAARGRTYRGTMIDNCRTAPMGKGHKNQGQPFDIETACYLKPLVLAFHSPQTRKLVILAGVKTMKSFFLELAAGWFVCFGPGDVAIFFGSGESADLVSSTRIMEYFKGIPSFARKLATLTGMYDLTMGAVKFPDKTLFIVPANLGQTAQKNLGFVGVQDCYVLAKSGMIDQAIARTTQYANEKKIVLESQGGETGFDFEAHYEETDQAELHVNCPCCGESHVFNWKAHDAESMTRPEDFEAVLPLAKEREIISVQCSVFRVQPELTESRSETANPSPQSSPQGGEEVESQGGAATPPHHDGEGEGGKAAALPHHEEGGANLPVCPDIASQLRNPFSALNHAIGFEIAFARQELSEALRKPERRIAGFKRGDDELIKFANGDYNEAAILRQTHFECFHCGERWLDDGEFGATRIALDKSSHYVATRLDALPANRGFNFPQWINRRLVWGEIMLDKLKAQKIYETTGNIERLKQWWQKVAGRTWDPKALNANKKRAREDVYDVAMARHNAWRLCMIVDNQKDLMQQWAMVMAVQKNGASRQIWRGPLLGLQAVRAKQLEYGKDAKGNPLLKDQWVFLDARYMPEQICQHIIEHKYGHWATINGERVWACWSLMQGSRNDYQTHADERDKTRKFICGDPNFRGYKVDRAYVEIEVYPFSTTACGERFEASRDGKGVETAWLPRQPGEPPDDHELSHHSQIHSNKLVPSNSFEPRAARMKYVPVPASAPDHYFHMWRMFEAVKEKWGVDGMAVLKETPGAASVQ